MKTKIIMLGPTTVVGGITTWLKVLLKYSSHDQIEYNVIDTSKKYQPLGSKLDLSGSIHGLYDALSRFVNMVQMLITKRAKVVYINCSPSIGLVVRDSFYMYLLFLIRIKTIVHLHGGNVDGFFGGNFIRKVMVRLALASCRAIIVITREVEAAGKEIFGEKKIIYMPNMFDDDLFNAHGIKEIYPADGHTFNLAHVAWQSQEKGSLDLVNAMNYVKSDVLCVLVGVASDENKRKIEERIRSLNVGDRIRLIGQKTGQDIVDIFEKADIFILPTHKEGPEGFPMVILEAMAYGIPIIANNVGNIAEMIGANTDNSAGLILTNIDPVNAGEIAELIDRLVNNVVLRKTFSTNGKRRIQYNYLASKVVPELESVLMNLTR